MQTSGELEAAWAWSTREKIRRAAEEVAGRNGDVLERLVRAWPYLRPLYPNTVPGQVGLTDLQRRDLQEILDAIGGPRGPAANGPYVRRLERWEAAKLIDQIRRLAASLLARPLEGMRAEAL